MVHWTEDDLIAYATRDKKVKKSDCAVPWIGTESKPREDREYIEVSKPLMEYIHLQYPDVLAHHDYAGVNLSKVQAGKMKSLNFSVKWPDVVIAKAMHGYHAMYLELKTADKRNKNGTVAQNDHVRAQAKVLERLVDEGNFAVFACGFDEAKNWVDKYLNKKNLQS